MSKNTVATDERILDVYVQPRACRNEILGCRNEFLKIRVTASPTDGEANRLCQEILAKALGTSPSRVEILYGHKARRKRLRVNGVNEALWRKFKEDQNGMR